MKRDCLITAERVRALLDYDHATGVLRWRVRRNYNAPAGAQAGCLGATGYLDVRINGVNFRAHRLIWLHVYGNPPRQEIDHINGVRHDNRLANLRDVSKSVNQQNQRRKSGRIGAHWNALRGKWSSCIVSGKRRFFLGWFDSSEAASAAYMAAKRLHHSWAGAIDIDAIKSSGANSDERSLAILRLHDWREWVAVTDALCAERLRDGVSSAEFERFVRGL